MKPPILGRQTFLAENTERIFSFEKFLKEVYYRPTDIEQKPLYTGRYFVIQIKPDKGNRGMRRIFEKKAGFKVAGIDDYKSELLNEKSIADVDALVYDEMGIALISGEDDQIQMVESNVDGNQILVPEKIVYVPDDAPMPVNIAATWGITATGVINSAFSGSQVKVAVLDTGFDLNHPDFSGRILPSQSASFTGDPVDDVHGHGTHCVGIACGNTGSSGVRYGVAKDAIIYIGKVLGNSGSGAQSWILNGINWATKNDCKVISMSLGSRVLPGQGFDRAYELAAQFANSKGALIIAAVGNDSRRAMNIYQPVGCPADSPSIIGVGALDINLNVADFSNRSINPGANVDLVAPGVDIYSSWPMPQRYRSISGTSMATPYVAGIAALLCQKYPTATPQQITQYLIQSVKVLPLPTMDVGAGLSIAP